MWSIEVDAPGPRRGPSAPPVGERDAARTASDDGATPLVCARCRRLITTTAERVEVEGLHQHTQINQHGFVWSFRCFAGAPGVVAVGSPTGEFTWFAGHLWQLVLCGGCRLHLGWRFDSPDRAFHGLIVERVIEEGHPPAGNGDPGA